jgi:hypothetical protein
MVLSGSPSVRRGKQLPALVADSALTISFCGLLSHVIVPIANRKKAEAALAVKRPYNVRRADMKGATSNHSKNAHQHDALERSAGSQDVFIPGLQGCTDHSV